MDNLFSPILAQHELKTLDKRQCHVFSPCLCKHMHKHVS